MCDHEAAGFSRFQRGAFRFSDRDHLFRMRACEITSAGETAAAANLREQAQRNLWLTLRTLSRAGSRHYPPPHELRRGKQRITHAS
jgi:hypothetical protein